MPVGLGRPGRPRDGAGRGQGGGRKRHQLRLDQRGPADARTIPAGAAKHQDTKVGQD